MGYNTTIVLLNDYFHRLQKDEKLGEEIYRAATESLLHPKKPVDINGKGCSYGQVLGVDHSSGYNGFVVGGNTGFSLGFVGTVGRFDKNDQVKMLEELASNLGYKLKKKGK